MQDLSSNPLLKKFKKKIIDSQQRGGRTQGGGWDGFKFSFDGLDFGGFPIQDHSERTSCIAFSNLHSAASLVAERQYWVDFSTCRKNVENLIVLNKYQIENLTLLNKCRILLTKSEFHSH